MAHTPHQARGNWKRKTGKIRALGAHRLAGIWVLVVTDRGCHHEVPKVLPNRMDSPGLSLLPAEVSIWGQARGQGIRAAKATLRLPQSYPRAFWNLFSSGWDSPEELPSLLELDCGPQGLSPSSPGGWQVRAGYQQ